MGAVLLTDGCVLHVDGYVLHAGGYVLHADGYVLVSTLPTGGCLLLADGHVLRSLYCLPVRACTAPPLPLCPALRLTGDSPQVLELAFSQFGNVQRAVVVADATQNNVMSKRSVCCSARLLSCLLSATPPARSFPISPILPTLAALLPLPVGWFCRMVLWVVSVGLFCLFGQLTGRLFDLLTGRLFWYGVWGVY